MTKARRENQEESDPRAFTSVREAAIGLDGHWKATRAVCWITKKLDPQGLGLPLSVVESVTEECVKQEVTGAGYIDRIIAEIQRKRGV